jgi:hypothetical protein
MVTTGNSTTSTSPSRTRWPTRTGISRISSAVLARIDALRIPRRVPVNWRLTSKGASSTTATSTGTPDCRRISSTSGGDSTSAEAWMMRITTKAVSARMTIPMTMLFFEKMPLMVCLDLFCMTPQWFPPHSTRPTSSILPPLKRSNWARTCT